MEIKSSVLCVMVATGGLLATSAVAAKEPIEPIRPAQEINLAQAELASDYAAALKSSHDFSRLHDFDIYIHEKLRNIDRGHLLARELSRGVVVEGNHGNA